MKKYTFYREDILNLLTNHKSYFSKRAQEEIAKGRDIRTLTYGETYKWTEEFFDETMASSEITVDSIMDEVEDVLKSALGKNFKEYAQDRSKKVN